MKSIDKHHDFGDDDDNKNLNNNIILMPIYEI